jgi:hypothetical protein
VRFARWDTGQNKLQYGLGFATLSMSEHFQAAPFGVPSTTSVWRKLMNRAEAVIVSPQDDSDPRTPRVLDRGQQIRFWISITAAAGSVFLAVVLFLFH